MPSSGSTAVTDLEPPHQLAGELARPRREVQHRGIGREAEARDREVDRLADQPAAALVGLGRGVEGGGARVDGR